MLQGLELHFCNTALVCAYHCASFIVFFSGPWIVVSLLTIRVRADVSISAHIMLWLEGVCGSHCIDELFIYLTGHIYFSIFYLARVVWFTEMTSTARVKKKYSNYYYTIIIIISLLNQLN